MRMDHKTTVEQQADVVNDIQRDVNLYRIIRDYGEDKFAKNIAKHIVKARRTEKKIETTKEFK